jgi:hypothetical protein
MQDKERYFRNRSREAIVDMFRVIRYLQQVNDFKDSEIIRAMISVWRSTEETTSFAMLYLYWMAVELERDEESKQRSAKAKKPRD